jgi:RNA polymerase sigma-70 factor (ECF subfamily)
VNKAADPHATFAAQRPRLTRIAYRMLGTHAEAEDVVQNAWLRWRTAPQAEIDDVPAYLARIVTRLCLDHLKSARVRRETYVGAWLPEPLIERAGSTPPLDEPEDVTLSLMFALERLSPLERASFLLHDVFDLPFAEVATAIGRDEAACRQLAARARAHVRAQRPRYRLDEARGSALAHAFFNASNTGDVGQLSAMLAEDVVAWADGGGKIPANINPIRGRDRVLRFLAGLARKWRDREAEFITAVTIDGLPGYISRDRRGILQTTALELDDRGIIAIYTMRNPDKLGHVMAMLGGDAAGRC